MPALETRLALATQGQNEGGIDTAQAAIQHDAAARRPADVQFSLAAPDLSADEWAVRQNLDGVENDARSCVPDIEWRRVIDDVDRLTTNRHVVIISNMKALALVRRRVVIAADAFAEVVVWRVLEPVPPSSHTFKYRLAYVVDGECVLRYDNERGKGDHRHAGGGETPYVFTTPDRLMADFEADVTRWNHEHGRA